MNNTITDTSSSSSIRANNISSNDSASVPRPHGGKLINKFTAKKDVAGLFSIEVSTDLRNDIENIADGIFSP
ncbi:MAG TPA: hypothetical protein VE573_00245, partial [Nitrososphaeraceae archaeon]|nr:hypothetical protein [Nitrososphaeraceae archaeon]